MNDVLTLVDSRLRWTFGEPDARASVTFLGTERIEVLRFLDAEAGTVRYATLGMSAAPMTDPAQALADPEAGPRAELLLTVRAGVADTDKVLRPLAVLAASPQVEGVVVAPGASLDTGGPLWPGAPFTSVLVAEPGGLVEDLPLDPPPAAAGGHAQQRDPVRFLPLLPMTPAEAAWKRVHGADALREQWLRHETDLRDPLRRAVPL
ncbi:suppressor of fused domain protein [Streptomyces smyrnaeus]|uniref:suppressor of fused domain protein n=1 Tax=Streptomyces TaxID=1883 RepID=UPI000C1A1DD4|nr:MULTISPECIES: suppressor of fused domain protein [unclassified Streptomyces]MBQ0867211.1 suppressor of fused domain protein [Streptomyces sp. RK75]MBQ1121528.1 suppressor of fused domain protein [Streptomyces sp. B15]MBQ1160874.1 suppressor of fused domain protein [Streptomyces sp. A73]